MQDFKYNIIDNIINRKMQRLNQIAQYIDIETHSKIYSIQELMELREEVELISSAFMPYFKMKIR